MLRKPQTCSLCPLEQLSQGFSAPEGTCNNGVMIIGESLGKNELNDGLPFRPWAEAGSIIQSLLRRMQLKRSDFLFWNLVACQPPFNNLEGAVYEEGAINHCTVHFDQVFNHFKSKIKCILALGNLPMRYLCPEIMELYKQAKVDKDKSMLKKLQITSLRGYKFESKYKVPIISSLHPSFIRRTGSVYSGVLLRDLYAALQIAKGNIEPFKVNSILNPSTDEAINFFEMCKANPQSPITYDIETPMTVIETDESEVEYQDIEVRDIDSIQFCLNENEGIFLDWNQHKEIATEILKLPNTKIGYNNWQFDDTHIKYHLGPNAIGGQNFDMMWCLNANTTIKLASGEFKTIKEIVDNKLNCHVLSIDENGKQIGTKVIGWHKQYNNGQKWVKIKNYTTKFVVYATPDHQVWVPNLGLVRADKLTLNMPILLPNLGADDVIHGAILGDSFYNRKNQRLYFKHGAPQEEYAQLKADYFGVPLNNYVNAIGIKPYLAYHFSCAAHPKWGSFYSKEGKSFVPPPTNRALAVWYMDDGCLEVANKGKNCSTYLARIYTLGFINGEAIKYWARDEFGAGVHTYIRNGGLLLELADKALEDFFTRIREYIPPCMEYKLPEKHRGKYNGWFNFREPQISAISDLRVGREKVISSTNSQTGRELNYRYCISVKAESHLFFTRGGLVSNCWHHVNPDFNKLGRGLQFATNFFAPNFPAWKHLSDSNPKYYGVLDVIATNKIARGLDSEFANKRLLPSTKSIQEGFIDDIVKLKPILDDISNRGLPIDLDAREVFSNRLDDEIIETMDRLQDKYPFELRNVTPKLGYKYEPKEIEDLHLAFNSRFCDPINGSQSYIVFSSDEIRNLALSKFIEENSKIVDNEKKKDNTGLILKEFQIDGYKEKRWCRMEQFKPNSREQVLAYIKLKGYKVPKKKDFEKGNRETTSKDEIFKLAEEHPEDTFLNDIVLIRELKKMKSTYVNGWKISKLDGRVHTTFLPLGATGQLTSRNPNIQNAPSHGNRFSSPGYKQLATDFRKIIATSNEKVLLSADWSSFHALTLAFEAEDSLYMRLVKCDVHSFVAAHMLVTDLPRWYSAIKLKKPLEVDKDKWLKRCGLYEEGLLKLSKINEWLSYSDENLIKELKWIKDNFSYIRNTQAKNAILGLGFGMGVSHFYNTFRYAFKSRSEPENLHKLIRRLFPKVFVDYHERIRDLADQQTFLISRYGYIRRFYDVYDWRLVKSAPKSLKEGQILRRNTKTGELWLRKDGVDSNSAIAFNAANDAFGKKKEAMRDLWNHPSGNLVKSFGLINEIHDDLLFEVEEAKLEEAAIIIKEVMERPATMLKNSLCPDGLVTKVELKSGRNWGNYNDDLNKGSLHLEGMRTLNI